jgi:hypothetical protein
LSGSAASHGYAKGGSDFRVKGTSIEIEVTGDLTGRVSKSQDLWIRPDKIEDAKLNPDTEKWIIHHVAKDDTMRAILLDKNFQSRFDKHAFKTVTPRIRGTQETYASIPAGDEAVQPFSELINRLTAEKGKRPKSESKSKAVII